MWPSWIVRLCFFKLVACVNDYHKIHICDLFGLHELCKYVASNMLNHEMICHKNHICDLCDPHELCGCIFSNNLNHEIICHTIHICELRGLHELCLYVSSDFLHWKRIYHRSHTFNLCSLLYNMFYHRINDILLNFEF